MNNLIIEANELHTRLQNRHYDILKRYALYPSARPDAYSDPRIVRLNHIIARANARRNRRYRAARHLAESQP